MKKMKFAAVVLAFATAALSITGCGSKFDAKTYVQGSLNATFKNEISDDFAKLTEGGKEAIEGQYNEAIETLVSTYETAGCPAELLEDYKVLTQDLLKACRYTVGDAVEGDNGNYTVTVTIEPIILTSPEIEAESEEFIANLMADATMDNDTMTTEVFKFILQRLQSLVSNPTYGDETTVDVQVVKTSNNLYEIPERDLEALTNAMTAQ